MSGVAAAAGALGLLCSTVLAVGALVVALELGEGGPAYDTLRSVCDVLVGPLRGLFSFDGPDAETRQAMVAWGIGSVGYLLVGLVVQTYLRGRLDQE